MSNVKYCHNCGAQNVEEAAFCKLCGTDILELPKAEPTSFPNCLTTPDDTATNQAPCKTVPALKSTITDAPSPEEASLYMGDDSESLLKKYNRYLNRQSVFNWPVFFFSLLGVPFVWFFYRKLYKVGAIVLAVCFVLSCSSALLKYLTYDSASESIVAFAENSVDAVEDGYRDISNPKRDKSINDKINREWIKTTNKLLNDPDFMTCLVLIAVLSFIEIAFALILPIFANKIYFAKMKSDIKTHKTATPYGGKNVTLATTCGFTLGTLLECIRLIPVIIMCVGFSGEFGRIILDLLSNFGIRIFLM